MPTPDPLLSLLQIDVMIAMRVLMLAALLGVATAAAPFGTPGADCSVATRPQIQFPGAYVTMANVRAV
jgi:hypothetical protein